MATELTEIQALRNELETFIEMVSKMRVAQIMGEDCEQIESAVDARIDAWREIISE